MTIAGTVINGVIILDGNSQLPEGQRVIVDLDGDAATYDYPHPMALYDREKELSLLRQAYVEAKAGKTSISLAQFEAEFAKEFHLSPIPQE